MNINKIDQSFSFLAKQHCYLYAVIGVIFSFLFIHYMDHIEQVDVLKKITWIVLFIFVFSRILFYSFYEKYEIGGQKMPMTSSVVLTDNYFIEKIQSGLTPIKKATGYLYVVFRIVDIVLIAFILGICFSLLLNI